MKTLKFIFTISLLSMSLVSLKAQTADEIIKNYFETIDSEGKLSELESYKMIASVNTQGMEIPVEIVQKKGGKMYVMITLQGQDVKQMASDGETVWSTNFMTMKAEKMDSQSSENMKLSNQDFPDPLLNYQSKGYSVEYLGKETKEGTECYKVQLTKKPHTIDGEKVDDIIYYYFDTENNIPILTESVINEGPMKGQLSTTTFSDYDEVEGIYFPFSLSMQGQAVTVKEILLNPVIDDSEFKFVEE